MEGIAKVIEELGLIILAKEIELETLQNEVNHLKEKLDIIEEYLESYEDFYKK